MTEAAKLQKKTINKAKLKKSIKNILCRPDPVFWPAISTEDSNKLENILNKHKVDVPVYKKPHWNDIKSIPKENRPKPPAIPKVEGLVFGISECSNAIQKQQCSAVIIEADVNPRTIVQPLLEKCNSTQIPVVAMKNFRKICVTNFGIPTSCLGIKDNSIIDLHAGILSIVKKLKYPNIINKEIEKNKMEIDFEIKPKTDENSNSAKMEIPDFSYLYRTNKKTRIFIPSEGNVPKTKRDFAGHDFIQLSQEKTKNNKMHMKMIMKRISNNPNRNKKK